MNPTYAAANPYATSGLPQASNSGFSGPSIESFQKDGFKIMGRDPIKPKNEEGQREFAELFNLADTKIKDRAHDKPKYDLTYKPTVTEMKGDSASLRPQSIMSPQVLSENFLKMTLTSNLQ